MTTQTVPGPKPSQLLEHPTFAHLLDDLANFDKAGHIYEGKKGDVSLSFAELSAQSVELGRRLLSSGLRQGDRVALILPEPKEFIGIFLACLRAGIVPVPLYPPLALGRLGAYMESTQALLTAARVRRIVTSSQVEKVLWPFVDKVATLDGILLANQLPEPSEPITALDAINSGDLAFLQYTSGSTSRPKGVRVTHASLLANCRVSVPRLMTGRGDDVWLSWLPLYHDMGLIGFVCAPLTAAIPTVYMPTMFFLQRPSRWLESITRHRATVSFSPNFGYALAARKASNVKGLDLSSMHCFGCGAEPVMAHTLTAFAEQFATAGLRRSAMMPAYGMAEATLAITFADLQNWIRVDRVQRRSYQTQRKALPAADGVADALEYVSCGRALPGHEVSILGLDGQPLPERSIGEIFVRGPSITDGYDGDLNATAGAFTKFGLRTGDLGYLVDGELFVTGRCKDLIIINGRNIDPHTVEHEVANVVGVRAGSVVAFSVPSTDSEALVIAAESNSKEPELVREAIRKQVIQACGVEAAAVTLLSPGSLPKTTSGKLQRAKTREQYLASQLGREGSRKMGGASKTSQLQLLWHLGRSLFVKTRTEQVQRFRNTVSRLNTLVTGSEGQ